MVYVRIFASMLVKAHLEVCCKTFTIDTTKAIAMRRLAIAATRVKALMQKAIDTAAILINDIDSK